jgi:hypothetical protein
MAVITRFLDDKLAARSAVHTYTLGGSAIGHCLRRIRG